MANHIPTKTSFKKGHRRSSVSIDKQVKTMKSQIKQGIRKLPVKPKGIKDKYKEIECLKCKNKFIPVSERQKWCKECVPDRTARRIMQGYGLSHKEYLQMLSIADEKCPICLIRNAEVIDHSHKTGKVRGIICYHCNMALHLVENKELLQRALNYLNKKL